METYAERTDGHFVLNGTKTHINLAAQADSHKVYAMTYGG